MSVILMFNHFMVGVAVAHMQETADAETGANQNQQTAHGYFMGQNCPDDTKERTKNQQSNVV